MRPRTPPDDRRRGNFTQARRLALLRGLLTDDQSPLRARVAACLLLLYAQPASRIVRLTIGDVLRDEDRVLIRLGEPPSPVPEPLAALLLRLVDNRPNINSAANPGSRLPLLYELGVPAQATRVAALTPARPAGTSASRAARAGERR